MGSGSTSQSALDLAKDILAACNNDLDKLGKFQIQDFTAFKGVGPAKAINLISALELGRRKKASESKKIPQIKSIKDIFELLSPSFEDLQHEEFHVVYLNRANKVIDIQKISSGGISGTVVDIRMLCKPALLMYASGVILSHNHPSGNLKPSHQDQQLTKKVKEALLLFDIQLLDHLIITDKAYFSFADEGIL